MRAHHPNKLTATGTYTGDGAVSQAITGIGFPPLSVWVVPDTFIDSASIAIPGPNFKFDGFPAGFSLGQIVRSTYDNTIISLDADGFTVDDDGADEHPNKGTQVYFYLCVG